MRNPSEPRSPEREFERWRTRADARALGNVFDRLAPELLIIAAHVADRGTAEDLVQTTFLHAIDRAERWDESRPLLPWLIGILVKLALRERARAARHVDPERVARPGVSDPESEAEKLELGRAIADALEELPLHYRQVLTLRLVHGLEPAAIAHALGSPVATVKSRLQRGMQRLRDALPAGLRLSPALALPTASLDAVRESVLAHAASKTAAVGAVATTTASLIGTLIMTKILSAIVGVALIGYLGVTLLRDDGVERSDETELSQEQASLAPRDEVQSAEPEATAEPLTTEVERTAAEVAPAPAKQGGGTETDDEPTPLTPIVRGRVVDENGTPLPAVHVVLADCRYHPFRDVNSFISQATEHEMAGLTAGEHADGTKTNEAGRFEFERPQSEHPHLVIAWSADRGGRGLELPADDEDVEIVLPVDAVVSGSVRDAESRAPIENAKFQVWPLKSGYPIAYESTDASGRFELQRLPPGDYRVRVDAHGYEDGDTKFTLLELQDEHDVSVELQPLAPFRAQLVDEEGRPWTLARASDALGADRPAAARWTVSMTEKPVARRGELEAERWLNYSMKVDESGVVTGFAQLPDARTLTVWRGVEKVLEGTVASFEATEVSVTLTDRASVSLRVRVSFDPPAQGPVPITVSLTDPSGFATSNVPIVLRTTEATECTLQVPAAFVGTQCGLKIESERYVPYEGRVTIPDGTLDAWHEVTLSPPDGRLSGVVVDVEGDVIAQADLTLVDMDGRAFLPRRRSARTTKLDGSFTFDELPARRMLAMVASSEHSMRCFEVDASDGTPLRLQLLPAREFSMRMPSTVGAGQLRVLDEDGRPQLDDRISGTMRYGGAQLRLDEDAAVVEVYDAATGEMASRAVVPTTGELVFEAVD